MATQNVVPAIVVAPTMTSLTQTLGKCLVEARPAVQGIFLMRFLVGVLLVAGPSADIAPAVVLGALAWWAATVFIYLLNGVMDVTEDRVNGSRRPVATGDLPVSAAWSVCVALPPIAALVAAQVDARLLVLVLAFLVLGYAYSAEPFALKRRTMGASVVATAGGLASYAAGYVVAGGTPDIRLLVFGLAMSCWMGMVGIQAKDLSDVVGDAAAGRQTIAMRYRDGVVRRLLALTALGVGGAFVVAAAVLAPRLSFIALIVLGGAALLAASVLTRHSHGSRPRRRRPYRVFMLTQYVAHLCLVVTALAG
jgi:4-hydroxybenzoate polyprenyltransferase